MIVLAHHGVEDLLSFAAAGGTAAVTAAMLILRVRLTRLTRRLFTAGAMHVAGPDDRAETAVERGDIARSKTARHHNRVVPPP